MKTSIAVDFSADDVGFAGIPDDAEGDDVDAAMEFLMKFTCCKSIFPPFCA
ncbi:conserved hypothetical protein [delta proteobacterium NaphS2]|nr:conserved hypothetical protein [delta proteobacterium NaphS2]